MLLWLACAPPLPLGLPAAAGRDPYVDALLHLDFDHAVAAADTDARRELATIGPWAATDADARRLEDLGRSEDRVVAAFGATYAALAWMRMGDYAELEGLGHNAADAELAAALAPIPPMTVTGLAPVTLAWATTEIPLPMVAARIGDREVRVVLDTGAQLTVVDDGLADALGLSGSDVAVGSTTGDLRAAVVAIPTLGLGPATFRDVAAIRADLDPLGTFGGAPIAAIVGWPVLARWTTTLRPGVSVSLAPAPPRRPGNLVELGHAYLRTPVNGTPTVWFVDTGATNTTLTPAGAARLGLDVIDRVDHQTRSLGGVRGGRIALTGGDLAFDVDGFRFTLSRLPVVTDALPDKPVAVDGTLGMDALGGVGTPVVIDGAGALRFTP